MPSSPEQTSIQARLWLWLWRFCKPAYLTGSTHLCADIIEWSRLLESEPTHGDEMWSL